MNLHLDILAALTAHGITPEELADLQARMLGTVTGLQAEIAALDMQISTLTAQRDELNTRLASGIATVNKLITGN